MLPSALRAPATPVETFDSALTTPNEAATKTAAIQPMLFMVSSFRSRKFIGRPAYSISGPAGLIGNRTKGPSFRTKVPASARSIVFHPRTRRTVGRARSLQYNELHETDPPPCRDPCRCVLRTALRSRRRLGRRQEGSQVLQ